MTNRDFVYWLNGFFEIENPSSLNEEQTRLVKEHLELVFNRIVPSKVNNIGLMAINNTGGKGFDSSTTNFAIYEPSSGYSC